MDSLPLIMFLSSADFFFLNQFFQKKRFQEYHQGGEQYRSRSCPTFGRALHVPKLFARSAQRFIKPDQCPNCLPDLPNVW